MENFEKNATYEKIKKAQSGDELAKNELIKENTGLVYSVAKRFYQRGYDKEDIDQLAMLGLFKAIERFDFSQNVRFSTYAVPQILGEIRCFLRDDGPIKVSRSIKQTALQAMHYVEVEEKQGKTPGVCDIAEALGVSCSEIIAALEATRTPESISKEYDDGKSPVELLKSDSKENDILTKIDIKNALDTLPERESNIIRMRYFEDKPQREVAQALGISQVQVSRLEKKILKKLHSYLECESYFL